MLPSDFAWIYSSPDNLWLPDEDSHQTLVGFRTLFMGWLNRGDMNITQGNMMVNMAIKRINRELRVPEMEQIASYVVTPGNSAVDTVQVPSRLCDFKDVIVDNHRASPVPYRMLRQPQAHSHRSFCRQGRALLVWPPARKSVEVSYFQGFAPLRNDSDYSALFDISQDLLLWACLSYAGDYFKMQAQPQWEANYQTALGDLMQRANDLEFLGGPLAVGVIDEANWELTSGPFTPTDAFVAIGNTDFGGDIV